MGPQFGWGWEMCDGLSAQKHCFAWPDLQPDQRYRETAFGLPFGLSLSARKLPLRAVFR
jgi:hypothetical protein